MHSSPGGPIAILFMMVPLIVVPLIAIFGIPNLPTNLSSAATEESAIQFDSIEEEQKTSESADKIPSDAPDFEDEVTDLDSEAVQTDEHKHNVPSSQGKKRPKNWKPPAEAMEGWSIDSSKKKSTHHNESGSSAPVFEEDSNGKFQLKYDDEDESNLAATKGLNSAMARRSPGQMENIQLKDSFEKSIQEAEDNWISDEELNNSNPLAISSGENESEGEQSSKLSWEKNIQKLRSYGIKTYQMVPGTEAGEFLFRCAMVSPRNARLVFRFEAEAEDPLDAVADVVKQVGKWHQQH